REAAHICAERDLDPRAQSLLEGSDVQGYALAVTPARRGILRRPMVVVNAQRRAIPSSLAHHLRDRGIIELEPMLDGVATAIERAVQPLAIVGVAGDLLLPAMRLLHNGLQLLKRQRGLRDQVALLVEPRAVRHVDLDPVGPMVELLPRRLARLHRAVNDLHALGHLGLRRLPFQRISTTGGDRPRGRTHPRAWQAAWLPR